MLELSEDAVARRFSEASQEPTLLIVAPDLEAAARRIVLESGDDEFPLMFGLLELVVDELRAPGTWELR